MDPVINPTEPADDTTTSSLRRRWVLAGVAALVAVVVVASLLTSDDLASAQGRQYPAGEASLESGFGRPWKALVPTDGRTREGWPLPMVASGPDQRCFGFARRDFEVPAPSLARCVDVGLLPTLDPNGLRHLVTIDTGADVWRVVQVGGAAGAAAFETDDGALPASRIHLGDDLVVIRVPAATAMTTVRWQADDLDVVCRPDRPHATDWCPPVDEE